MRLRVPGSLTPDGADVERSADGSVASSCGGATDRRDPRIVVLGDGPTVAPQGTINIQNIQNIQEIQNIQSIQKIQNMSYAIYINSKIKF